MKTGGWKYVTAVPFRNLDMPFISLWDNLTTLLIETHSSPCSLPAGSALMVEGLQGELFVWVNRMQGVWRLCPKGQRRGGGTGRSHGPASSEEPLHRSWPLSRIPSPPLWKQQPLLPPEDVAAPSPCEPAWMGSFHILQSPFLLLDKKALFLPPLSMSWLNLLGKVIRLGASLWAWRGVEDKKRVIEFTRKGNKRGQSD